MTPRSDEQGAPRWTPDIVLEVWQRRKWLAGLTCVATLAGSTTVALSLPNLYRATATVLVERQQVSEAFVRPSVTAELETRIQTIHQLVMSRARLIDVIGRFRLYPEMRGVVPIEQIVERMRREVQLALQGVEQASGRGGTIAFTVSYTGRDPYKVTEVVNALTALYVQENTKSREQQAAQTAGFLKGELADAKRELDEHEQRVTGFQRQHVGELSQQAEVNLAALDRLNNQLRLNGERQIQAIERRERLEQQVADSAGADPPPPDTPAGRLFKLREELSGLRRKFSDQYPEVVRVEAEIAALEKLHPRLEQAGTDGHPGVPASPPTSLARRSLAELDREQAALKKEEAFLRRTISDYEARLENAPTWQQQLQQLTADYESSKDRYQSLLKRYDEAQLAEDLERGQNLEQFRVLDPAIAPTQPVAPNRLWLLTMGLLVSLGLGLGAMVVAERLDTTFHTADELREFTSVPVLATLGLLPTEDAARRRRVRLGVAMVATLVCLAVIVAGSHHVASGNEQLVRLTARAGLGRRAQP